MERDLGTRKTHALERYSRGALATEADAMKVLEIIWPRAPIIEKKRAAMLCVQYQLNPLMRHLFLIPFKNKSGGENWATVLGIQANRLIAHRAGQFSYVDNTPRVMSKQEQETILGEVFEDRIWAITKLRDSSGNEAVGYGFWMKGENPYGTDKGNTKANMAFIRSERQAMDRLFAGKMPEGQFEVGDERFVDTQTGEIIEVSAGTLPQDQPTLTGEGTNAETHIAETVPPPDPSNPPADSGEQAQGAEPPKAETTRKTGVKNEIAEADIKTLGDLKLWCIQHGKQFDTKWLCMVSGQTEEDLQKATGIAKAIKDVKAQMQW